MHGEELKSAAVQLRQQGWSVPAIAAEIGIARSTAYQWTKHVPREGTAEAAQRRKQHSKRMTDARWAEHRVTRDTDRAGVLADAAGGVGALTEREITLIGAVMYWCEGNKAKPWRPNDWKVKFTNSDAGLIRLFLRFLEQLGYTRDQLSYRLSIHETGNVPAAQRWWEEQAGLAPGSLTAVSRKRHQISTIRRNVGEDYHGCLVIVVPRASRLYWRIQGIMDGLVADC
ncbi:MAG TPA: helix-turn-helix domain-containing protein [Candidatus Limnocylindrales bacterium]